MQNRLGHRFQRRIHVPDWLEPKALSYAEKVLNTDYANLIGYWPMWEPSGAIAYDQSPEGNDGAYTGVTLGQPGIGDGATCPLFDGINDFNNIYSAALNADFDGAEGTLMIWARVSGAGVWTDATLRRIINLRVDGANRILIQRSAGDNQIAFFRIGGGTTESQTIGGLSTVDWMKLVITWSEGNDEVKYYLDGVLQATDTVLGAWAGNLGVTTTVIGAASTVPADPWDGFGAHATLWTTPLSAARIAELAVP